MKRFDLPGYDVNYRDGSDHNTPAGKKIAELNNFLIENGIRGGIACLDEKGQTVQRYTDRVALEIDDSTSPEKLEKIKKIVSELLRAMGATETQLGDVFKDDEFRKLREGDNNMDDYEKEKFGYMRQKLARLIETMDIIEEYSSKADSLGIRVKKDFTFDKIYRTGGFDGRNGSVDFNDLRKKFEGYSYNLQKAVEGKTGIRSRFNNMGDYEKEKFDSMRKKMASLIKTMDIIGEFVSKADELGIYVEKDFEFDRIYRTGGFDGRNGEVDFNDLYDKFMGYSYKLQKAVAKKQKNK